LKGPRSRWTGIPRYPEHQHTHKVVKDFRLTDNPIKVKESSVTRTRLLILGIIIILTYRRMMMNSENMKVAILSCVND
jgi:hypothetical protein